MQLEGRAGGWDWSNLNRLNDENEIKNYRQLLWL